MAQKNGKLKDSFHFYLFDEQCTGYTVPTDYSDCVIMKKTSEFDNRELKFREHMGLLNGLYYIWKNDTADYVGFTLDGSLPGPHKKDMEDFLKAGKAALLIENLEKNDTLINEYRSNYYDFDMRAFREILEKNSSFISDFAEKEMLNGRKYYFPCAIMRKDVFRKFCLWLFPLLEETAKYCAPKISTAQNNYLEHLATYAFTFYFEYNSSKINLSFTNRFFELNIPNDEPSVPSDEPLMERAQKLIDEGKPEGIELLLKECAEKDTANSDDYKQLKAIYDDYIREKRYFRQANLDVNKDLKYHIKRNKDLSVNVSLGRKPRLFIMKWNSFNNDDMVTAFEKAGFEVDFIRIGDIKYVNAPGNENIVNSYLDSHKFDVAYTTNYLPILAEGCYTHKIPYLAWSYDSPTNLGDRKTVNYDTSHVFFFDSDETYTMKELLGFKNVYHLPLAVDCERYDSMELTDEDRIKYGSDVSFVGGLYDNKLNEYLNYLNDYQKGFINAAIDGSIGKYDGYALSDIVLSCVGEWFGNKAFYKVVKDGEKKGREFQDDDSRNVMGHISVLANKTVTNRERLILVSMLSNHFDFKLYSNGSHEVFKNVKECGLVSYNEEMPKVFKCSRINLNITMKTIRRGIPLRCLDIMGNHGFLLSNYQRDFDEHFKDGENVALFHSLEEAFDKCEYYLAHESERAKIAEKGYETVKKYYNYSDSIEKMLKLSGLDYLIRK